MKVGIRAKLFLVTFALIVLAVLVADVFLTPALDNWLTTRIQDDLAVRLALAQRDVEGLPAPLDDLRAWDALAHDLGGRARARVTVIRADGTVVGDSEVALADLPALENHAGRPEVVAALRGGSGTSQRWSRTIRERMLYLAAPFRRGGLPAGVVRAAVPLAEVDQALARARGYLAIATLLALAVAALALPALTRRMTRDVRAATAAAGRMAAGELTARTRLAGRDEIGELGRSLDHLADSLQHTLGELTSERDVLSSVLDSMSEGVLLLSAEGRIALVNPALREMLLLPGEVVGKRPLEAVRHAELQELLAGVERTGEPATAELELSGVKPRRLLCRASRLRGGRAGALAVFFDVTELRKLESLRRDFVANVSHELRTPVTAVRSAAETLQTTAAGDPAAAARFVDIIARNAERLQALVDDLLDLSRIDSRQYQLRLEPLEVSAVLRQAVEPMRQRADARRVTLLVDLPAPLLEAKVLADRRALDQVLANLVDNALKYGGAGSTIKLGATEGAKDLELVVGDDGPGIEAKHLPRIFERFYRVDAGRSREQGGTGLGLSIVKNLVEAMGGRVSVDSAPGKGSTFRVALPRAA